MFWVLVFACSTSTPPVVTPPPTRPSLVFVTMDTTRRDRIGAYGYAFAHTPNVDRFAAEGIRFDRAYATVPLTIPAHASIFTGVYPMKHGVHSNGDGVLPESFPTLAELLQASGYATAASVSAFVTTRAWNFDQGFDTYLDDLSGKEKANRWRQERPANEVVDDAIGWLMAQSMDRPTFLWVHLYDPHRPYDAPAAWKEQLPERPYDAEIAFMDEQIGRLRAAVDQRGAPTAWMLLADHGEALGEHGEDDHGLFLFEPTAAIPFVIVPTDPVDVHVSETVASGVDVVPTALAMAGLPAPSGLDGANLLAPGARDAVHLEAFSAQQRFGYHPELAVVSGDLKLMDTPSARLFDVAKDPREQTNLAPSRPEDVQRLRRLGLEARSVAEPTASGAVSSETLEQLEALGYVGGAAVDTRSFSDVDAKDRVEEIRRLESLQASVQRKAVTSAAEREARALIEKNPSLWEARSLLAQMLRRQKRFAEAERLYRESIAANPSATELRVTLASCLAEAGKTDEALGALRGVLDQVPEDEQARVLFLRLLTNAERYDEADAQAQAWLESSPESHGLMAQRGVILVSLGRVDEAERYLRASMKDDVPRLDVLSSLGGIAVIRGDAEGARRYLEEEVARYPFNLKARWSLAGLHMDAARWDDAADEYRLLTEDTGGAEARRAWAQAVYNAGDYGLAREILAPLDPESSDDPDVLLLQVNILDKLGEDEIAKSLFERGKALHDAATDAP
jgi:arylsulfatase A-like enzyme/Flp pilus assembly protein TadD